MVLIWGQLRSSSLTDTRVIDFPISEKPLNWLWFIHCFFFQVQTLIVKFLSCAFAVGCGMPVGYEGPMIHLGSLVAAGMSQFKSATFECSLPCFSRFRNSEDRRNFISAGAAAGIASAFGAPVGGLLFAMEEVSSFWKNKLSWQVFFCCMVATFTTDLLNSSFHGFKYKNDFGLFKTKFTSKVRLFNRRWKVINRILVLNSFTDLETF